MGLNMSMGALCRVSALVLLGTTGGCGKTSDNGTNSGVGGLPEQPLADVGPQQQSSKLDVLFVVDNSEGMGDEQTVFLQSVPAFVSHLVNPLCLDASGKPVATQPASGSEACATGTRALTPVTDMHLGVITTSLGSHGGTVCATPDPGEVDPHLDDQAELIPAKRDSVASYMDSGFASWDAAGQTGDGDPAVFTSQVQAMIGAVGHTGCGFEAPLEAMYRFLVDPEPPLSVESSTGLTTPMGINQELLQQRAAFLRPDSAVAIVILSEENDCSIVDSGVGWFVGSSGRMPKASVECAANPNDRCCRSCAQNPSTPTPHCPDLKGDANCAGAPYNAPYNTWDALDDSTNLRCFDQMRRFGFDLLNPIARYSDGLTNPEVYDRAGKLVPNPLLAGRSASLVSVSMIVGVPWQDLATDDSMTSPNLTYLGAADLESEQRWPMLVGDPENNVAPSDPLMVEAIDPRTGTSPVTQAPLVTADSTDPLANPSNGHEQNAPDRSDLQYACTFPLATPKPCAKGDQNCVCSPTKDGDSSVVLASNSPACQPPAGGPAGTTQYYAPGYPGTRELLFAHSLGDRAVAASICPKQSSGDGLSYGYVPALDALVSRIGVTLE